MTAHRRYANRDKYPVYYDEFDRLQSASKIISSGAEVITNLGSILWDERNTRSELLEIQGNEEGKYLKGDLTYDASIPLVKQELNDIEKQFNNFIKQRLNEGKKKPEWPPELLDKKYRTEAKLDCYLYEVDMLQAKIKKYEDAKQVVSDSQVLAQGPKGTSKLLNGEIVELDGQKVSKLFVDDEYLFIIDDNRSPYDGMSTIDYYSLVVLPWSIARFNSALRTKQEADKNHLDWDKIPHGKKVGSNAEWPKPQFKNYKKITEEVK
jgi:hypothetical protein